MFLKALLWLGYIICKGFKLTEINLRIYIIKFVQFDLVYTYLVCLSF